MTLSLTNALSEKRVFVVASIRKYGFVRPVAFT